LADLSRDLDTASRQSAEWARKIAWLESRARGGSQEARVPETAAPTNGKLNITERRHRVLSLARRGQDVQTIARTLGMPHGEVELMINLGQAA
jgi:DNA-binding NarL/FixJ family response regulator